MSESDTKKMALAIVEAIKSRIYDLTEFKVGKVCVESRFQSVDHTASLTLPNGDYLYLSIVTKESAQ